MFDDPQLDVDKEPTGPQYDVGDLVFTCDNEIMVVEDVQFIGSVYNGFGYDKSDPSHYDYLLMDKECNEYWYMNAQIEHKANHMAQSFRTAPDGDLS